MEERLELTPELREKLKGFLPFDSESKFKYVPLPYRLKNEAGQYLIPKELWPVFTLKSPNAFENAEIEDAIGYRAYDQDQKEFRYFSKSGTNRIEILKRGVIGWRNLLDEDGNEIKFDGKKSISKLPNLLVIDLCNAITEHEILSEEELQGLG